MITTRRNFLRAGAAVTATLPLWATAARAQTTHTVTIRNMAFSPAELRIAPGDTVTWVNEDRMRHSATDLDGAFDTDLLGNGESASLTFDTEGTFNYRCRPHGNMRGTIIVG